MEMGNYLLTLGRDGFIPPNNMIRKITIFTLSFPLLNFSDRFFPYNGKIVKVAFRLHVTTLVPFSVKFPLLSGASKKS
jgi:hypothetical protein